MQLWTLCECHPRRRTFGRVFNYRPDIDPQCNARIKRMVINGKNASLFNAKRDINALEEICFEHKDPYCKTEIYSRPTAANVSSDPPTSDPASDTLSSDPPTSAPPSSEPVTNRWACPITWVQRNIPPLSNDFAIFDDSPIKVISDLLNSKFWPNFRHGQSDLQIFFSPWSLRPTK